MWCCLPSFLSYMAQTNTYPWGWKWLLSKFETFDLILIFPIWFCCCCCAVDGWLAVPPTYLPHFCKASFSFHPYPFSHSFTFHSALTFTFISPFISLCKWANTDIVILPYHKPSFGSSTYETSLLIITFLWVFTFFSSFSSWPLLLVLFVWNFEKS